MADAGGAPIGADLAELIECIKARDWPRLHELVADPRQTFPKQDGLEIPVDYWREAIKHVVRKMPRWNILALLIMFHDRDEPVEVQLKAFLDRGAEVLPGCCEAVVPRSYAAFRLLLSRSEAVATFRAAFCTVVIEKGLPDADFETYLYKLTTPEEIPRVAFFAGFRSRYLDDVIQQRIQILLEWGADPEGLEDIVRAEPSDSWLKKMYKDWEKTYRMRRVRAISQAVDRKTAQQQGLEVSPSTSPLTPILDQRVVEGQPLVAINIKKRPCPRELGGLFVNEEARREWKRYRGEEGEIVKHMMMEMKPELLREALALCQG